ncbi:MAG: N-acetylmuramoyl-L-alanine amidase [Bacillota bacterium]|nr:N-acetylmuramoyl-L-alanine amidase [Bacillota bacterium]
MSVQQTLLVNGQAIESLSLRYVGRVVYVHLTAVFNALGGHTVWQARENQAVVTWRNNMLIVPAIGRTMTLNGEKKSVSHPSQISQGMLYVALESLAEVFAGLLNSGEQVLELTIPTGRLRSLSLAEGSMVLQWTGNERVEALAQAEGLSFLLLGTTWPSGLKAITIKKTPQGHLAVAIDAMGTVGQALLEQSMRLSWKSSGKQLEGIAIALDAGHGGQQSGAVGHSGKLEKELTRAVVDKMIPLLVSAGATVLDVRPGDQSVTLTERVQRARQGGAKAFVSIHYNAFERAEANGTETFHATGNKPAGELAALVQAELVKSLGLRDRGVKQAAFHVVQAMPEIPSILVEVGFITNPSEEAWLLRESTIVLTAEAIMRGLLLFYNK